MDEEVGKCYDIFANRKCTFFFKKCQPVSSQNLKIKTTQILFELSQMNMYSTFYVNLVYMDIYVGFCLFAGVKKVVIAEKSLKGRHYLS